MLPKFLQPERVPYASVEIVRDTFHTFLTDPQTGPTLDAMLADNAAVDAAIAEPRDADDPDDRDDERGSTCGSNCGYCGGCS